MQKEQNLKVSRKHLRPQRNPEQGRPVFQRLGVPRRKVREDQLAGEEEPPVREEGEMVEKEIRDTTVELVKKYRDKIGLELPIPPDKEQSSEIIYQLLQFFTRLEASLSLDADEGIETDRQLLDDVSRATDDFNLEKGEFIDVEKFNKRLIG